MICGQCGTELQHRARTCPECGAKLLKSEELQWDFCRIVEQVFRRGAYLSEDLCGYKAEAQGPTGRYLAGASRLVTLDRRESALKDLTDLLAADGWETVRTPRAGATRRFRRPSKLRPACQV